MTTKGVLTTLPRGCPALAVKILLEPHGIQVAWRACIHDMPPEILRRNEPGHFEHHRKVNVPVVHRLPRDVIEWHVAANPVQQLVERGAQDMPWPPEQRVIQARLDEQGVARICGVGILGKSFLGQPDAIVHLGQRLDIFFHGHKNNPGYYPG